MRRNIFVIILGTLCLLSTLATGTITSEAQTVSLPSSLVGEKQPGASSPLRLSVRTLSEENASAAEASDAALAARQLGLSLSEIKERSRTAAALSEIVKMLQVDSSGALLGTNVRDPQTHLPTIYLFGDSGTKRARELASTYYDLGIQVQDGISTSLAELTKIRDATHTELRAQAIAESTSDLDVVAGRITVTVSIRGKTRDYAELPALIAKKVSNRVTVTLTSQAIVHPAVAEAFGGMNIGPCTSGFSVFSLTSFTTGITTAGHCWGASPIANPAQGAYSASLVSNNMGYYGDVGWLTTGAIEPAAFYATSNQIRRPSAIGYASIGTPVCGFGRVTNDRRCGIVTSLSKAWDYGGYYVQNLMDTDRKNFTAGDSGGPWSYGTTVYGSYVGYAPNDVISQAVLYDEALGVAVRLGDVLDTGETLFPGDMLKSQNGQYMAIMQTDGNFVIYGPNGPVWYTNTFVVNSRLVMQSDGNLVIYTPGNQPVWYTNTFGSRHYLTMQDDRNLVMYRRSGGYVWYTGTHL